MDRETVYEFGVQSGLLMKGQDFGFKFDQVMQFAELVAAAEGDAALGLLRELVETRDKHYIYQTEDVMFRWDERVAAAIRARGDK